MRTIIDLPEEQRRSLDAYCARERISLAEAVRRAVTQLLSEKARARRDREAALDAAYGLWADRNIDGVEYQQRLRAEWEHRESGL